MIRPVITLRRIRIIVDIDTQRDYLLANGTLCARNHPSVLANIRRLMAWARLKNIRMISTARINPANHSRLDFCVEGTAGQKKVPYTIRNRHISFTADGCTDLPRDILRRYDQIIVDKRCDDPFDEPRADRILSELKVTEFVVFGALTECAVKSTVLGLLARRRNVTVITDAVGYRDKELADIALRQMEAKGANMIDTKTALGPSHLHLVGVCDCDICRGKADCHYRVRA
ncbi:MAG: cysteine hydrolase [Sedimentisphaerales bacterium]|nr:cysteine hydrolase [Sedimentisphaerales bacterium]